MSERPEGYDENPCWDLVIEVGGPASVELVSTVHHAPQQVAERVIGLIVTFMEAARLLKPLSMGGVALSWGRCHCHNRQLVKAPDGRMLHSMEMDAIKTPTGDMRGFRFTKDSLLDEPDEEGIPLWARGMDEELVN